MVDAEGYERIENEISTKTDEDGNFSFNVTAGINIEYFSVRKNIKQ